MRSGQIFREQVPLVETSSAVRGSRRVLFKSARDLENFRRKVRIYLRAEPCRFLFLNFESVSSQILVIRVVRVVFTLLFRLLWSCVLLPIVGVGPPLGGGVRVLFLGIALIEFPIAQIISCFQLCLYSIRHVFVLFRDTEATVGTEFAFAFPRKDDKVASDRFEVIAQRLWKKSGDVPVHFERCFVPFDGMWIELCIRRDVFRLHRRLPGPVVQEQRLKDGLVCSQTPEIVRSSK